jgi:hypothetical protein
MRCGGRGGGKRRDCEKKARERGRQKKTTHLFSKRKRKKNIKPSLQGPLRRPDPPRSPLGPALPQPNRAPLRFPPLRRRDCLRRRGRPGAVPQGVDLPPALGREGGPQEEDVRGARDKLDQGRGEDNGVLPGGPEEGGRRRRRRRGGGGRRSDGGGGRRDEAGAESGGGGGDNDSAQEEADSSPSSSSESGGSARSPESGETGHGGRRRAESAAVSCGSHGPVQGSPAHLKGVRLVPRSLFFVCKFGKVN